ncbi:MAG: hypothetical protein HFF06_10895 [Oscillospiraceae bacterium]|jgi:hypothetical protein|nr:hypothetical protein [Oscillospiraceae bacterium]
MRTLYIIGNGFDIAHGLPTTYWNFREYLSAHHPDFLHFFEEMYDTDFPPKKFWSALEIEMGHLNITQMEELAESVLSNMDLEPENVGIKDTMDYYWEGQYGFIKKLQGYIEEWISSIDLSNIAPLKRELVNNDEDLFLNFNYTETLEKVYGIANVLHIHGHIGAETHSSPIMGHGNSTEIAERLELLRAAENIRDESGASIQSAIATYLERTFKDTNSIILQNYAFFENLSEVDHIIIFGWAIGECDVPYLQKIGSSGLPFKKWTIYYHKPEDLESIKDTFIRTIGRDIYEKSEVEFLESKTYWDERMDALCTL